MPLTLATLAVLAAKEPHTEQSTMTVQFNPETLTVTHAASAPPSGGTTPGGSGTQNNPYQPTTYSEDLALDLFFDSSETGNDVRQWTLAIARMLAAPNRNDAPIVRFQWGTFLFYGQIKAMTETINFFSAEGKPLRASVNLRMTGVDLEKTQPAAGAGAGAGVGVGVSAGIGLGVGFSASVGASAGVGFSASASINAGVAVGTTPLTLSQSGESVQAIAARAGVDWKTVAAANNIDNPRQLRAGTVLNLNTSASASAGFDGR